VNQFEKCFFVLVVKLWRDAKLTEFQEEYSRIESNSAFDPVIVFFLEVMDE
jgi:hypothetical protein